MWEGECEVLKFCVVLGGSIGTGVSVILTVSACCGVELGLFTWPVCPLVVDRSVADCVDVGLGG